MVSIQNDRRYAIVTGVAQGGIGYYIVKGLVQRGYYVTLACRNQQKTYIAIDQLIKDDNCNKKLLHFEPLDVSDLESVQHFTQRYTKSGRPLHVLVCNAGIYKGGKTKQDIDEVFAANYLGHFALTQLLTPVLIQSQPARVVNVASMFHRFGNIDYVGASKQARRSAYGDSKLYQIMAGRELHRRLRSHGVSVYSVHPGAVNSNFYGFLGEANERRMKTITGLIFLSPEQGAQSALSCIFDQSQNTDDEALYVSPHKKLRVGSLLSEVFGTRYSVHPSILDVSSAASNDTEGRKLVEFSEQLIHDKLGGKYL